MNKTPHPHQVEALSRLRQSLLSGKKRPIIQAPTGAGKTLLAAMIVEGAIKKGNRVLFVVPAISLVDQTVRAFYDEGIEDIGVIQANHEMTDSSKPVQVASVQTLMRRDIPESQVVVIDEAHRDFKFTRDWMQSEEWKNVPFIGLSATPWTKGLGKYWDDLIVAETTQGLIEKGYLSPFRAFASAHPDLSKVKIVAGDYHEGQLSDVMQEKTLAASVISTWLEKGEDRPTFCFAVDCSHAKNLQRKFENAGVPCGYIDAFTSLDERLLIKEQFDRGEIRVVCNVGTLTTGIDWDVRCILLARPTHSEMLYVQMIGRGLRTAPGKKDCLILDFADNTERLGFVTDVQRTHLCDGTKAMVSARKEKEKREKLPKSCPQCTYLKPLGTYKCPQCGFETTRPSIKENDGELFEVTPQKTKYTMEDKQAWYSGLLTIAVEKGYKRGWAANKYREKFKAWPRGLTEKALPPLPEVINYVKAGQIRWAKKQASLKKNGENKLGEEYVKYGADRG